MPTGSWRRVAIALITVSLVVHTAMSTPPGQDKYDPNTGFQHMLKAMNRDVSPCMDFYEYACGAWRRNNPIPRDSSSIDTRSMMRSNIDRMVQDLLGSEIAAEDSKAVVKAKTLYQSCMAESLIEERGTRPLIDLMNNEFGGWPLLGALSLPTHLSQPSSSSRAKFRKVLADFDGMNWLELMGILRTYNSEIILGQTVAVDSANPSRRTIVLYPAELGLPSPAYYDQSSPQFEAYGEYMEKTAELFVPDNDFLLPDIHDILNFETGLADILKSTNKQDGPAPISLSIAEWREHVPAIDLNIYFNHALSGMDIDQIERVTVYGLEYLKAISKLIDKTSDNRILADYLLWRFVMNRMYDLGKPFSTVWHEYATKIFGPKYRKVPRQKVCADLVEGNMRTVVGSLFIKRYFDRDSKREAETMVTNVRQAFERTLHKVDWMDEVTRGAAIQKIDSMKQHVGYYEPLPDTNQLNREYQHLNFGRDTFFENAIQLLKSVASKTQSELTHSYDEDKWPLIPNTSNVQYLPTRNLLSLLPGVFQQPYFHKHYPKSHNYGALGTVIGRELTRTCDQDGRNYDHKGNEKLWWTQKTAAQFQAKAKCIVNKYDAYSEEIEGKDMYMDGPRTLSENIADYAGVKAAYEAYLDYEQANGPEQPLPGVDLTHNQMFFIKFAQNWCQNMTPESTLEALETSRTSLNKFRVIGALSNYNEFSKAFGCPTGTTMNPAYKCTIW